MLSTKKKQKSFNHREKKVFNYWIWLVIIGPAIFFLYYWFSGNSTSEVPGQKPFLPEKQLRAGEQAAIGNIMITAAPEGRVTYSEQLTMGTNKIIAEGGQTFMVVPLVVPDNFGEPSPSRWYLTGSGGVKYDLLRVVPKNPVAPDAPAGTGPGNRLVYLIFKVKKGEAELFLVYLDPTGNAAWKMPPP
ncbi:MAG: hypothetical protein ACOY30_08680 [Bacillota bacterium]